MEDVRTIRDVMIPVQDVIDHQETILTARRRLESEANRSLIVVDGDVPLGVLEWRQIMRAGDDMYSVPVADVMSRELPELTADMTFDDALPMLTDVDVSIIPVVDTSGHLIGEVPRSSLTKGEMRVDDVPASSSGVTSDAADVDVRLAGLNSGMTVVGSSGSKLGELSETAVNVSGQLDAVIVAHGLFGRKHKRVSADLISRVDDDKAVLLIDQQEFKALPDIEQVEGTV